MKNEMIDLEKIEQLIQSKSYADLSEEEKEWIGKWVISAGEYENLRSSEFEIRQYFQNTKVTPKPETLIQLTNHLRIRSRARPNLFWQLKPTFGAVLMSVFLGGLGWWIGQSSNDSPQIQAVNTVVVHDTIFVASKPDTIFTEKVVYKDRQVILTRSTSTEVNYPIEKNGISMKEKEELEKLLVSGTDQ